MNGNAVDQEGAFSRFRFGASAGLLLEGSAYCVRDALNCQGDRIAAANERRDVGYNYDNTAVFLNLRDDSFWCDGGAGTGRSQ